MTDLTDQNFKEMLVQVIDTDTGEISDQSLEGLVVSPVSVEVKEHALAEVFSLFNADCESYEQMIKKLERQLMDRCRKREAVRETMAKVMKKHGIDGLKTAYFEARFKKNPPSLMIEPGADVTRFTKTELVDKVDKIAIKQALQSGEKIEGCSIVQNERLEIK